LVITMTFCLLVGPALAEDDAEFQSRQWHHWRGPNANGVVPHGNPPVEWSETKNVQWKREIPGRGSATPIVWGDRIILLTAKEVDSSEEASTSGSSEAASAEGSAQAQPRPRGGPESQRGRT